MQCLRCRINVGIGGYILGLLASAVAGLPFTIAVIFVEMRPWWVWPLVVAVFAVALVYALYQQHQQNQLRDDLRASGRSLIVREFHTLILTYLNQALAGRSPEQGYRANLMLVDGNTGSLVVRHYFPDQHSSDLDLTWDRWVGCCGHAWGSKEVTVCNLSGARDEDLRQQWKLIDERYKRTTSSVGAIISYPIRRPSRPDVVGVLNCDTTLSLDEANFDADEFKKHLKSIAESIGRTLDEAGII